MNFNLIESFIAISKHKNLSKAADALYITQPTLSSRLKNLEKELNLKLVKRSWQGVELTSSGYLFLPNALKIIDNINNFSALSLSTYGTSKNSFVNSIENIQTTYRIGINNYLIDPYVNTIIKTLKAKYPDLKFEFVNNSSTILAELFKLNAIDLVICYSWFYSEDKMTRLLQNDNMVLILSENDLQKIKNNLINLKTLNKPVLLNSNPVTTQYRAFFDSAITNLDFENFKLIDNLNLIRNLVLAEEALSILPYKVFKFVFEPNRLKYLFDPMYLPSLPIFFKINPESPFIEQSDYIYEVLKKINYSSTQ